MAFIRQRLKRDCGVAALAMLCDVSYEEARGTIPWFINKKGVTIRRGTTTKQLKQAAHHLGYETRGTPTGRLKRVRYESLYGCICDNILAWNRIPNNSLVKVPGNKRCWHWVVWHKGKIYDPARGVFKPKDYDHKPSSYMEFIRCTK